MFASNFIQKPSLLVGLKSEIPSKPLPVVNHIWNCWQKSVHTKRGKVNVHPLIENHFYLIWRSFGSKIVNWLQIFLPPTKPNISFWRHSRNIRDDLGDPLFRIFRRADEPDPNGAERKGASPARFSQSGNGPTWDGKETLGKRMLFVLLKTTLAKFGAHLSKQAKKKNVY